MADADALVLRADELARASEGELVAGGPDRVLGGFSIDSRRLEPGDLFVAIRGDRFDGHDFVEEAVRKGAAGMIISDRSAAPPERAADPGLTVIVVADTTRALQLMARHVRRRAATRVVAITGSVGKTTTKELAAAFIGIRHRVARSAGNLNNQIGLPLSLLELRRKPDVAVVEFGMNHAGEIRRLVDIAEPNLRVWTNVAEVHAAFFASIEAIADAKAEILEGAGSDDHLVVNANDARAMARIGRFPGLVTTFGLDTPADVQAYAVDDRGLDGVQATVETAAGRGTLRSPLIGVGNVANALAAIGVALQFHVPLDAMLRTLETFEAPSRRGAVRRLSRGVTVVDDSYNSNPAALTRVLESVGRTTGYRRRVAVLGEMLELGPRARRLHRGCGRKVAETGFDRIVAIGGPDARALAAGAREGGLTADAVTTCATSGDAADIVARFIEGGELVLVKGSRGIRTDLVVDRLTAEWA